METNERIEKLEHQVAALERELHLLKNAISAPQPIAATSKPIAPSMQQAPKPSAPPSQAAPAQPAPLPREPKPPIDWEHLIARVWLPRIFIVVFLIGVLWGFTAAVNAGFITEPIRCFIGVIAAALMYWQAERQTARKRSALGQVLHGGAVAVLILSLSAAHLLYDLIPSSIAFILYILSIAVGLFTAIRHRSQVLMIIMMVAGYLIPFLVDSENPNIQVFIGYEAAFSIAMLWMADRFKYRVAFYFAYLILHLPLLITYSFGESDYRAAFLIAVLAQHLVLFALCSYRTIMRDEHRTIILYSSYGLLVAWTAGLYSNDEWLYRSVIAISTLVYGLSAFWFWKRERSYGVYASIATMGLFLLLIDFLDAGQLSAAMIVEGIIAILLGISLKSVLQQVTGWIVFGIGSLFTVTWPIDEVLSDHTLAWVVLLAAILVLYAWTRKLPASSNYHPLKSAFLWTDAALLLIFITQITNLLTESLSWDLQRLILSGVWLAFSITFIIVGVGKGIRKARLAGVIFLLVTLLKVIFTDLPDVSTAIRAILFLSLGGIGVAVSRLFYKGNGKKGTQLDNKDGDHAPTEHAVEVEEERPVKE